MTDHDALSVVLAATGPVLLDFDGPVTPIFAGNKNRAAADHLRNVLAAGSRDLPADIATTDDPLDVLRYAGQHTDAATLDHIEAALRHCEIEAAHQAVPTPGAAEFLAACHDTHRLVVIVSNNGTEAIHAYLERHQLSRYVRQVIGRPYAHPELMKPHPAIVLSALTTLDVQPQRCVLIGDSITDIEVAHATGVRSIGYVKTPQRRPGLEAAGSDAAVDSMSDLASVTRSVGSALPN